MEIITGRFSAPVLGFPSHGIINSSPHGYRGESNIIKKQIDPVFATGKEYSDLYMLERDSLITLPFNWIYVLNEQWVKENKNKIFNNSHNNSSEFQDFVDDVKFPVLEDSKVHTKERNHLLTNLSIPFRSIDKVIVLRNYEGYFRAENYIQKFYKNAERINHFKDFGSPKDRYMPKAIEFILK